MVNKKKTIRIIGFTSLGLLVLGLIFIVGINLYYNVKFPVDEDTYPHYVGYIDQDKAQLNDSYSLCNKEAIYFTHHSAAEKGFSGSKKRFRDNIIATYTNNGYPDSGYLNFRLLVSCEGNPGWFETIQVAKDYSPIQFSKELVTQLLALTAQPEHWNIITLSEQAVDYYRYVSYKIENGTITEILPWHSTNLHVIFL
jgi:hypothetical protein